MHKNMIKNYLAKTQFAIDCYKALGDQLARIDIRIISKKRIDVVLIKKDRTEVPLNIKAGAKNRFLTHISQNPSISTSHTDNWVFIDTSNTTPAYFFLKFDEVYKEQMVQNNNQKPLDGVDNISRNQINQYQNQWSKLLI